MGLEAATYINQLVATNPVGATDPRSQGDDHLRLIKLVLQNTLPALTGAVTSTHTELNQLHGGLLTSIGNGLVGTPAYSFASDPDTGMYRNAANDLRFAAGGVNVLALFATSVAPIQPVLAQNGSAGTPQFSFINDPDTGLYSAGANDLRITAGGAYKLIVTGTYVEIAPTFYFDAQMHAVSDGSAGAPVYSWFSDPDTGIYRRGANDFGFSAAGALQMVVSSSFVAVNPVLYIQDGTAGAPAIGFNSQPATGFFHTGGFSNIGITCNGITTADFNSGRITLGAGGGGTILDLYTTTAATANAGGVGALPATVRGYLNIYVAGVSKKVPYYDN